MSNEQFDVIKVEIAKLDLHEHDILVVFYPDLKPGQSDTWKTHLIENLRAYFKPTKVLLMPQSLHLAVISRQDFKDISSGESTD